MQIDPPSSPVSLRLAPADLPRGLRLGSELTAQVDVDSDGQLSLRLSTGLMLTPTQSPPLNPGETLLLKVAQLKPSVILQVLAEVQTDDAADALLRELLPRPEARQPLPAALQTLARMAEAAPDLPEPVRQAVAKLMSELPRPQDLAKPERLPELLAKAGLFLESRLAHGPGKELPAQLTGDLKALLLRLVAAARSAPQTPAAVPGQAMPSGATPRPVAAASPQPAAVEVEALRSMIAGHAERAVARLEVLQLHAAHGGPLDLLVELPVPFGQQMHQLQLRIQEEPPRREAEGGKAGEPGWLVRLAFGFEGLGRMSAAVRLAGERVSVHWWAERPEIAGVVGGHLESLRARLEEQGFEVAELTCLTGPGPAIDDLPILRRRGMLNEKA